MYINIIDILFKKELESFYDLYMIIYRKDPCREYCNNMMTMVWSL